MSAAELVDAGSEAVSNSLAAARPFLDLPAAVIASLAESSERRSYRAGEAVVALGQFDGSEAFFVESGALKAAIADRSSGAMLIEVVRPKSFFGLAEAVLGDDNPRAELTTLTAETDAEIISMDAAALRLIISQRPSLVRNLMLHFARAVADAGGGGASVDASPERRILAALMSHVQRDAVTGEWRIERMPKHRELAEESGADEALAAGAIAKLIQDGVARRNYPGLVIADMQRFSRLVE
jgi:CRP-like cAMP-binding protein